MVLEIKDVFLLEQGKVYYNSDMMKFLSREDKEVLCPYLNLYKDLKGKYFWIVLN